MRVTPIDANIDLAASDLVRSPGLHASTIYNALYAELEPERYGDKGDGGPDRTRLGLGLTLEDALEGALKSRIVAVGENCVRPGEFRTEEGIAFSPDGLITGPNGDIRLLETKLTWMSSRETPSSEVSTFPEKFSKWVVQMMFYCHGLGLTVAQLTVCFVNGSYDRNRPGPQLKSWIFNFTERELRENYAMLMNFARSKGLV